MKMKQHLPVLIAVLWFCLFSPAANCEETIEPEFVPKKLAAICNYYSARCHANAIVTKFILGFPTDDGVVPPKVKIVSMYIEQPSPDEIDPKTRGAWDVGRRMAEKHDIKLFPSIAEALTLGGDKLAVDGVLYIGEHGKYPRSRLGVKMYPRLNHLEQIFRVFDASNMVVPVYCDKHLAYSWLDAKWVYDRAQELKVPMMAGSVLPVSWRDPELEHPEGSKITEAIAVGSGRLDSYGFHILEILQCMIERRKGGETGVKSVQCLKGKEVYEAAEAGKFNMKLAEAACSAVKDKKTGTMPEREKKPTLILIDYVDGTKGAILMANRYVPDRWGYAAIVDGKTVATEFVLEHTIYSHFSYLGINIQEMFITGKPVYPVERTLLTSGILDAAMRSLHENGKLMETPFLNIAYQPSKTKSVRPSAPRPEGKSVGPWSPEGFEFIDWRMQWNKARGK